MMIDSKSDHDYMQEDNRGLLTRILRENSQQALHRFIEFRRKCIIAKGIIPSDTRETNHSNIRPPKLKNIAANTK